MPTRCGTNYRICTRLRTGGPQPGEPRRSEASNVSVGGQRRRAFLHAMFRRVCRQQHREHHLGLACERVQCDEHGHGAGTALHMAVLEPGRIDIQ